MPLQSGALTPACGIRQPMLPYFFASFAQVSFNVIVRFHTCLSARGIGIEREIAEPLELIALFGLRIRKRRLAFRGHDFERVRIDKRFEIAARVGFGNGEEPVIQVELPRRWRAPRLPNGSCL